ncbi:MAG: GIY-YIG nuclease family protein [Phycisphaerae bacterium]|nr:GIY-YIG nuclease family protein [Phycisphaerae bacterium]
MDKEHILSEIKRTAEENGGIPLGIGRFEKETGIKAWVWRGKYWIGWGDAIAEAGYINPNEMQSAYPDDFLVGKLMELIQELGHFPTSVEHRFKRHQDKEFPSHSTFSRFGNKRELIETVLRYCKDHNVNDKVIDICEAAAAKVKPRQRQSTESKEIEFGFVYLMKSGKHFKIGFSKCAERREFELKILLPEKLELIHKIKTDDPVGIEKYWHDRFKDKRKNGEWFDLSASDVKAFKQRKFM